MKSFIAIIISSAWRSLAFNIHLKAPYLSATALSTPFEPTNSSTEHRRQKLCISQGS